MLVARPAHCRRCASRILGENWPVGLTNIYCSSVFGTTSVSLEANRLLFSPFAIQWAWPIPILIGTLLAPESPW